jgi:serine O-acetyltransferase
MCPGDVGLIRILFEATRNAGFRAVFLYRMGHWYRRHNMHFPAAVIERLMHHLCHCWILTQSEIGPGFVIAHVSGILVLVKAGKNLTLRQNVTLGGAYRKTKGQQTNPILGDNISVSPGAQILGPITVGSNTVVGANTVVTTDIPENSVVGAFRAEVIAKIDDDGNIIRDPERVFLLRRQLYERIKALEEKIEQLTKEPLNK